MDKIKANPIASKKEKGFPKNTTEHIVATTGSIQAIILAFVGPIKEKGFPKNTTEHIVATTGSIQAIILAFVGPIIPTPDR